jgi:deoxyadenosine/deoxycytidine kinase
MGKLIVVVGNAGVGKTAFTRQLSRRLPLVHSLEQHASRPFQAGFARDLQRLALPNQVDYLLLRAEQEREIRQRVGTGIQDGGLDVDFQIFTRLFFHKDYLSEPEFRLCERLYALLREFLPPPDLVIFLHAPLEIVQERFERRNRSLEIARLADLPAMEILLQDWLSTINPDRLLVVDASPEDPEYQDIIPPLLSRLGAVLG